MGTSNSSDSEVPAPDKLRWLVFWLFVVLLAWAGWWAFLWFLPKERLPDLSSHSNFGEMFGGINALFSAFAFAGVIYTILLQRRELALQRLELRLTRRELKRQANALASQNRGSMHERLYNENHALLEYLAENPTVRPFFYLPARDLSQCANDEERAKVLLVAEMYAGYLELIALHLKELPDTVKGQWARFVLDQYDNSPAIQQYLEDFVQWYSPPLWEALSASTVFASRCAARAPNQALQQTGAASLVSGTV